MILLAVIPAGLIEALRTAKPDDHVWCGADDITEDAYAALSSPKPSRFNYNLTVADALDCTDGAVSTIEEHHPGQTVWVERLPTT